MIWSYIWCNFKNDNLNIYKNGILMTLSFLSLSNQNSKILASNAQKYLYGSFSKLEAKLNLLWAKFLTYTQQIFNTIIYCMIISCFFYKLQANMDSLNLVNVTDFGLVNSLVLWSCVYKRQIQINKIIVGWKARDM